MMAADESDPLLSDLESLYPEYRAGRIARAAVAEIARLRAELAKAANGLKWAMDERAAWQEQCEEFERLASPVAHPEDAREREQARATEESGPWGVAIQLAISSLDLGEMRVYSADA